MAAFSEYDDEALGSVRSGTTDSGCRKAVEMDVALCDIVLFTERLNLSGFRTNDPKLGV